MGASRKRNSFAESKVMQKVIGFLKQLGIVLGLTAKWGFKIRSLVLAIPVFICAGALAIRNARQLPELVGINILASGEYQWFVSRGVAVLIPFGVTAVCLLMMLCSKKILYPWLISLFSLALPLVVWLTNNLPT
ncbi:MAG: hypothetical protein IJZ14_02240 [Oscillospiraceae bacterium]|nr:hypothetical protein [Oscillospiraceae bacterium]